MKRRIILAAFFAAAMGLAGFYVGHRSSDARYDEGFWAGYSAAQVQSAYERNHPPDGRSRWTLVWKRTTNDQ